MGYRVVACVAFFASMSISAAHQVGLAPQREFTDSETYHWILPVDHHEGVEVAWLHPNDCYVIQRAEGVAYFGDPPILLLALQGQLPMPIVHKVDTPQSQEECERRACLRAVEISRAIENVLVDRVSGLLLRRADHRPTPYDDWFGGAYADVGSEDRTTCRAAPEQLMLSEHLLVSRRGNCFQAKVPRVLSVHVRDQQQHRDRTGIYRGLLYIEHHHASATGKAIAWQEGGIRPRRTPIGPWSSPRANEFLQIQMSM